MQGILPSETSWNHVQTITFILEVPQVDSTWNGQQMERTAHGTDSTWNRQQMRQHTVS